MKTLRVKHLGLCDYQDTWVAMREFTETREADTLDELWLVEHPPVYTLGRNGDPAHILNAGNIPIVESDRGGQVTYHGPGQLIAYALFDLNRLGIGVRSLVMGLENAVIGTVSQYGIKAEARRDAPGVYVASKKIASLGLRVRKGCSYHGLSLNVDMDLTPFSAINPCGYPGLEVTQLADLKIAAKSMEVAVPMVGRILHVFSYNSATY
ncbi:MAG: lipoyl(octanoyl) transferase LipB [Candidatus Methylumidiphilus sp.]